MDKSNPMLKRKKKISVGQIRSTVKYNSSNVQQNTDKASLNGRNQYIQTPQKAYFFSELEIQKKTKNKTAGQRQAAKIFSS